MRKLPMIYQSESAECGLACLAMLAGYHGHAIDIETIRLRCNHSGKGLTLADLLAIADGLKFNSRIVRVEPETLRHLKLPALLHWDMTHFVVLKKVSKRHAIICDPARGEMVLSLSEVGQHLTGVAMECTPRDDFQHLDERQALNLWHFAARLSGHRRLMLLLCTVAVGSQVLALLIPYFSQLVIDGILPTADLALLDKLFILFLGVVAIDFAVKYCRTGLILHMSSTLSAQMSHNLFAHLLRLPLQFFERRMFTGLVAKFESLEEIRSIIVEDAVVLFVDALMFLGVLFVVLHYDWRLVACLLFFVALYFAVRFSAHRTYHLQSKNKIYTEIIQRNHMLETVRGIQTTKIFDATSFRMAQWRRLLDEAIRANHNVARSKALADMLKDAVIAAESIISIYIAARIATFGELSLGMLFAFFAYKRFLMTSCISIAEIGFKIHALSIHFDMLGDIVKEREEEDGAQGIRLGQQFEIDVRNLSVRYGDGAPIVDNLSFTLRQGDRVVLVGPSGVGKTTALKAFMKLIPCAAGQILVNGSDIAEVARASWLRQIGVVMQNDILFHMTIRENIAFGAEEIDVKRVAHAARTACVLEDIEKLPMKFETKVMEMGVGFSAGQIQRILIARALYREPSLLVMDEGTANLDEPLEAQILSNIRSLGISVLQAAHRPQVIRDGTQVIPLAASPHATIAA